MALDPKKMGEAISRNLKAKTGKTIEEWLDTVKKSKLQEKKSIMDFLKKEKELGHFQAQRIYEEFKEVDEYGNREEFPAMLFQDNKAMKIYKNIKSSIKELGKDVEERPCKTYIPFYRKNQFAIVYPTTNGGIIIGLNLSEEFHHKKFVKKKTKGSKRINFQTTVQTVEDLDESILNVIKKAYHNN